MHAKMQLQDKANELERIKAKQKRYEMKYQKYQLMLLSKYILSSYQAIYNNLNENNIQHNNIFIICIAIYIAT